MKMCIMVNGVPRKVLRPKPLGPVAGVCGATTRKEPQSGTGCVSISLSHLFQKSRMTEWVAVCADEAEEPVEIPTETDGKWG